MPTDSLSAEELASELAGAMPTMDERDQRVALAIYRLLANGVPVPAEGVAERSGVAVGHVRELLEAWPGVFLVEGRIVGFWGLALADMPHRLRVGERELRAWCAWDTLFLPELIGERARVESTCPTTAAAITMEVVPGEGVRDLAPATAVLSFLRPEVPFDADVVMRFCHFVHFFRDQDAADAWTAEHANTFTLPVDQAFEIGRLTNGVKFGVALEARAKRT